MARFFPVCLLFAALPVAARDGAPPAPPAELGDVETRSKAVAGEMKAVALDSGPTETELNALLNAGKYEQAYQKAQQLRDAGARRFWNAEILFQWADLGGEKPEKRETLYDKAFSVWGRPYAGFPGVPPSGTSQAYAALRLNSLGEVRLSLGKCKEAALDFEDALIALDRGTTLSTRAPALEESSKAAAEQGLRRAKRCGSKGQPNS